MIYKHGKNDRTKVSLSVFMCPGVMRLTRFLELVLITLSTRFFTTMSLIPVQVVPIVHILGIAMTSQQGWAVETTPGFNRLKPPRSICQKVFNNGQYESELSIENFKGPF